MRIFFWYKKKKSNFLSVGPNSILQRNTKNFGVLPYMGFKKYNEWWSNNGRFFVFQFKTWPSVIGHPVNSPAVAVLVMMVARLTHPSCTCLGPVFSRGRVSIPHFPWSSTVVACNDVQTETHTLLFYSLQLSHRDTLIMHLSYIKNLVILMKESLGLRYIVLARNGGCKESSEVYEGNTWSHREESACEMSVCSGIHLQVMAEWIPTLG